MVSHKVGLSCGDRVMGRTDNQLWFGMTCHDIRKRKIAIYWTVGEYWLFVGWILASWTYVVSHRVGLSCGDRVMGRTENQLWFGTTCLDIRRWKSVINYTLGKYWMLVCCI